MIVIAKNYMTADSKEFHANFAHLITLRNTKYRQPTNTARKNNVMTREITISCQFCNPVHGKHYISLGVS